MFRSTIKRVVILGSSASVGLYQKEKDKPSVFTEDDWNEESVKKVEQLGRDASGLDKYGASKAMAEHREWLDLNESGWRC